MRLAIEAEAFRMSVELIGTHGLKQHAEAADCVQLTDRGREQMAAYLKSVRVSA